MSLTLIIFGLLTGSLFSILVGLLGAQRNIGFGWSFLISLIFSPLVGLICVLLSTQRPDVAPRKWGCLGRVLSVIGVVLLIISCMFWVLVISRLVVV